MFFETIYTSHQLLKLVIILPFFIYIFYQSDSDNLITKNEEEDLSYGDWLKAGFRRRAMGNTGPTETRTGNDPPDSHTATTGETGNNKAPLNGHDVTRLQADTNHVIAFTEEDANFGKNNPSSDIMAITQYPHENMLKRDSQDIIPNLVGIDNTPKASTSVMGPTDMGCDNTPNATKALGPTVMGGVISKVTDMHRGLYSVPISYMQPHIDPVGLAEVMHDKVIVQPSTQKVTHAKANIGGTWKKLLRPMKPPRFCAEQIHMVIQNSKLGTV